MFSFSSLTPRGSPASPKAYVTQKVAINGAEEGVKNEALDKGEATVGARAIGQEVVEAPLAANQALNQAKETDVNGVHDGVLQPLRLGFKKMQQR